MYVLRDVGEEGVRHVVRADVLEEHRVRSRVANRAEPTDGRGAVEAARARRGVTPRIADVRLAGLNRRVPVLGVHQVR